VKLLENEKTLNELKLQNNTKITLIGSSFEQVMESAPPDPKKKVVTKIPTEKVGDTPKYLSEQKEHKKIIEKGVPSNAEKGDVSRNAPLGKSIDGLLNRSGVPTRLAFKHEEVWIQTKESTEKIPHQGILDVAWEAIHGKEEYVIMWFKTGRHENDKIWIYWVPMQYTKAIKYHLLGMDGFPLVNL
jgi:hypothetical protein